MTKKNSSERFYNVQELMEKLSLDEEQILHLIRTAGGLKEQHFVSQKDLNSYLDQKKIHAERRKKLEARAEEGKRLFEKRNSLINKSADYPGKVWEFGK